LPACILSGTPLVYTIHGSGSAQSEYDRGTGRVHRAGSRFIRHYIAVSENALNRLVRQDRVPAGKCSVIRNGILAEPLSASDHERAMAKRSARTRLGLPDDSFIVGSVGRLSVEKNYPLLVEAFSMLLKPLPASGVNAAEGAGGNKPMPRLLLIGDGADKPRIQAAIRQFGVQDHCVLPGVQSDIGTWLQAMDVFCLSSDTEGTSISLLEAGAAGLPSVVTDVGGNPEVVIDGESGIVVPKGDAAALCRALARLMQDSGERAAFGQSAARRVQAEYSMRRMVDAYITLYESSVAHRCCRR
jgi:glycosyltransferase involved in cell wall biosynthesis